MSRGDDQIQPAAYTVHGFDQAYWTRAEAVLEAKRLAAECPGQKFIVMRAVYRVTATTPRFIEEYPR